MSVTEVTDLSSLSSVGFFILHVFGCQRLNKFSVTLKYTASMLAILRKHVISDFVLSLNNKVIGHSIQPMLSNKTWALGEITWVIQEFLTQG